METRDIANNSRIARRLVLYDNTSTVSVMSDHALYVSSAVEETGYVWQTATGPSKCYFQCNIMEENLHHFYVCVLSVRQSVITLSFCLLRKLF